MYRILETQEEVPHSSFSPHLSLSADHMHQHENVLAVDSRDGYSNVLQHSHAMEVDGYLHNYMMRLAYLLH